MKKNRHTQRDLNSNSTPASAHHTPTPPPTAAPIDAIQVLERIEHWPANSNSDPDAIAEALDQIQQLAGDAARSLKSQQAPILDQLIIHGEDRFGPFLMIGQFRSAMPSKEAAHLIAQRLNKDSHCGQVDCPCGPVDPPHAALFDEDDQDARIAKLREELRQLGGSTVTFESMPADMEEEFLRHVLEYETAEPITLLRLLENSGLEVAVPDQLDDTTLTGKLQELIQRMATLGAYLLHTNHLSDRELYEYLYHHALREEAVFFPENPSYAYMIDLTGSSSDADNLTYLKYYAEEEYRKQWAHDWPSDPMPAHEDPPFDRDSSLPQSPRG